MQSRPVALSWALLVSCSAPQTGDRLTNPETGLLDSTETDSGLVDTGSPWTDTGEDTEDLDTAAETTPPSDTGDTDPPDPPEIDPCDGLPFGVCWVRTHPMMIAGLVVSMDSPPGSEVERFYQDFGANTVQFWADALPTEVDSWASVGHPDFAWVAWIDASGISYGNNQALGGVGADPAGRVGYQVGDEPRTLDELEGIQQGIDTVRAEDPDALVIVNFGNGETESERDAMLNHYGASMGGDIMSYDQYTTGYGGYLHLERTRRAALDHGLPYWRYLKSYASPGDSSAWPEASDMRWDAFKGLLYGYTGHTWFLYQVDPAHNLETTLFQQTGEWSQTAAAGFDLAATLNGEMAVLGTAITQLTSTDVRYIPTVSWYPPDGTTNWTPGAGGDPYITSIAPVNLDFLELQDVSIGFFTDDAGEQYVMVQNPTHASSDWPIMIEEEADFHIEFDFSGAPARLDTGRVQFLDASTGAVGSMPLTRAGGGSASLDLNLAAGAAVLFKYDTGATFAGQGS